MPTWCVVMWYDCNSCKSRVKANDGRLLQILPTYLASVYPVLPKYATGQFHLDVDVTCQLEQAMLTYGNPAWVSRCLFEKMANNYIRAVDSYRKEEKTRKMGNSQQRRNFMEFPLHQVRRHWVTFMAEEAEESLLNPYLYSNRDRYERELQSVKVQRGEKIAVDHTFQVAKNY